jgi:diguanylate cyclase
MTSLKQGESTSRSKALLKAALTFIGTHQLSANPVNYTVCYEYLLGDTLLLKQTIDKVLSENTPLTDAMMEDWFDAFFADEESINLRQSQADLMAIISKLTDSAALAKENVHQFDQVLHHSEKEMLDSHTSPEAIVTYLLTNTRTMQASMEWMQQQMMASKQNMSSLRDRLDRATEEALSDPLTGLTSHKGFSEAIENALLSADGSKSYPCLLIITIDQFKKINATLGLLLGDSIIKVVGKTLKSHIKGKDTVAGYGGEEFCVLLPETDLTDAVKVAENLRLAVEKTRLRRSSGNQNIYCLTISIGVAQYRPDEAIPTWFKRAEDALGQSKKEGRN